MTPSEERHPLYPQPNAMHDVSGMVYGLSTLGSRLDSNRPASRRSDRDWQRIRSEFKRLYLDEDKALNDVINELRVKHNFKATTQVFKKQIARWGFDKNLKQNEVEHILGIQAERQARGKQTYFMLRDRRVDIETVYRYQRRKRLGTSVAITNYTSGRSRPCHDLRPLTPESLVSQTWKTPNQSYEGTLLAFGDLFKGLVETRYYWLEQGEIVMPLVALRDEVSDICCSLVATKNTGFSTFVLRKLSLLLESIVYTDDAWTHCRFIYILWVLSTAGRLALVASLLSHLHGLVAALVNKPYPQYRFVQQYSSLDPMCAAKFAADIITLKADMVSKIQIENPVAFKLRSLDYDVFWREREQGTRMSLDRATNLLLRCNEVLGLTAVETLTILKIVLEDFCTRLQEPSSVMAVLDTLMDTKLLQFDVHAIKFNFAGQHLSMEAASELACIYCWVGLHETEAWLIERTFMQHGQTQSCLRREYSRLVRISHCPEVDKVQYAERWSQRKLEIENIWINQVEAIAPTYELLKHQTATTIT